MTYEPLCEGEIVRSKAGRDRGRAFVVWKLVDAEYVLLVDGTLRTLERPKKKKRKHLLKASETRMELKDRLENADFRKFLSAEGFQNDRKE
ncbi:MAG: RNA-binding protein [Clostridia bacterium]|nr:RNA-binding protein [Clostridia bacterium]